MNANQQRPVLQAMSQTHTYMYLVSTTDLTGLNVARNDDGDITDYSDRDWFNKAKAGEAITFQSLIGKTSGKPALVVSMPIQNAVGKIVGVGMFAADLDALSKETLVHTVGKTGYSYIVDTNNKVLAHPDITVTATELRDLSEYPPIIAMRQGQTGLISFTDEEGKHWRAYVSTIDNGWGFITQQEESEILSDANQFQRTAVIFVIIGAVVMLVLAWFTIRRTLQPIDGLIETVSAFAAGDLNQVAEVRSQDEIGILASVFNSMTSQIRDMISTLERRVSDRTRNLELAVEVGRSLSRVRALDDTLKNAVEFIRSQFDLYHVQVYLINPAQNLLLLQASTGTIGAELMKQGHNLPLDTTSINGRAAVEKHSLVVSDTSVNDDTLRLYFVSRSKHIKKKDVSDASASFRPNPLLPDTLSELAIPLIVDEKVIGVLDLQNNKVDSLNQDNLPAFEALAGQLAIAIQNANLLAETQHARAELETQARRLTRANWVDYLDAIHQPEEIGFVFEQNQISAMTQDEAIKDNSLVAPIAVTGAALGNLIVEMGAQPQGTRSAELVNVIALQVAQQIENLRLLESAERYRFEAEQASRRQTREGWQEYVNTKTSESLGYLYDLTKVRPYSNGNDDASVWTLPLKVRNEAIGKLSIQGLTPDDKESVELVNTVAERLSTHIEGLRLSQQTELALAETEELYQGSEKIAKAETISDVLAALFESTTLGQLERASLNIFDHPWDPEDPPAGMTMVSSWIKDEDKEETVPVGTYYRITEIPSAKFLALNEITASSDITTDARFDEQSRKYFMEALNARSVISLPLVVDGRSIGGIVAQSSLPQKISTSEVRKIGNYLSRVTTVIQSKRLFEQAQERAQRERALRQITSAVRGSTDPATILRSAAHELGTLLGRKTIVRLAAEKTSQTEHPADLAEEAIANSEHKSDSPAELPNADGGNK